MLSFLYVYSDHSILECYNLFSGVELSMRSFFVTSSSGFVMIKLKRKIEFNGHCYFQAVRPEFINRALTKLQEINFLFQTVETNTS